MFISIGSIIIDDIVLPDGQTRMGVLGGGGSHAAMGMRVWAQSVGLVAGVGANFPAALFDEMAGAFDVSGVLRREVATPRAWQVFEADGKRTEIFRTDFEQFLKISPQPAELPHSTFQVEGAHLECEVPEPFREWVARLRAGNCRVILWEPWDLFCAPQNVPLVRQLAPLVDVLSPNLVEAQKLTGFDEPIEIARALIEYGAPCVALRMGERGSLVATRDGVMQPVAAIKTAVVDVTGAGNAYCGAFVVGLAQTGDPIQAGRMAAVAASFTVEQFGVMRSLDGLQSEAISRLQSQ